MLQHRTISREEKFPRPSGLDDGVAHQYRTVMNNVAPMRRAGRQLRRRGRSRRAVEPSEGLLFRLMRCAYAQEEKIEASLAPAGLSIAKYSVLMHLATA